MTLEKEDFSKFEQLAHKIYRNSQLLYVWKLTGGISAQINALEILLPDGKTEKVVVRRYGPIDVAADPEIAPHECDLMVNLTKAGVPVPGLIFCEHPAWIFPTPYIVIEYIKGKTEFEPPYLETCLAQMAAGLAGIHKVRFTPNKLSFLREITGQISQNLANPPVDLDDSLQEGRLRETLGKVWPLPPRNPSGLLHGDYWPGNIIWQEAKLAAIIDWEDAKKGDPLSDLAITRLDILFEYGLLAMETFTQVYREKMPFLDYIDLPFWDLTAALRPAGKIGIWAGNPERERVMRERHHLFVAQAFEKLRKA